MEINTLVFLLGAILAGLGFKLIQIWLAHRRADRNLNILKSYIDQGKDPPSELLKILQSEVAPSSNRLRLSSGLWIPFFLFASMTVGFVFMALSPSITDRDKGAESGLIFVAILMGGLALGFLVTALGRQREENRNRLPPR